MADLYRKSSLEKISNPEQLDKVLKVTSPLSWLALIGITLIVIVTVVWSIVGAIPETITTQGIVSSRVGSNAVYAQEAGTVVSVSVRVGDELHVGDPVLKYKNASNEVQTIYSDQVGKVAALTVQADDMFVPGTEVIRVTPSAKGAQMVVCYVPLAQAKTLKCGMELNVTPIALDGQSYGHMTAKIVNIDAYASSVAGMTSVLGTGNNMEALFIQSGPVVAVACELKADADTASGYYWSNAKGADATVSNGSLVTAQIVIDEVAPITKLFSKLSEIWGD